MAPCGEEKNITQNNTKLPAPRRREVFFGDRINPGEICKRHVPPLTFSGTKMTCDNYTKIYRALLQLAKSYKLQSFTLFCIALQRETFLS